MVICDLPYHTTMSYPRPAPAASFALDDQYLNPTPTQSSDSKGPDPLSDNWSYDSAIGLFTLNTMMPDSFNMDLTDDLMSLDSKHFSTTDPFSQPPPNFSGFAIADHSAEDTASNGSLSSDHESDDRPWSPTYQMVSPLESSPVTDSNSNMLSRVQTWAPETTAATAQEFRRKFSDSSLPSPSASFTTPTATINNNNNNNNNNSGIPRHQRWSSSPDLIPHDFPAARIPSPVTAATATPITTTTTRAPPSHKMSRAPSQSDESSPHSHFTAATTTNNGNTRNAAKRAAHNVIEKRYRTNMNAKFLSLEKAMAVDGVAKTTKGGSASLKKSEILTNAISYIQELQEENRNAQKELAVLKQGFLPANTGIWGRSAGNNKRV